MHTPAVTSERPAASPDAGTDSMQLIGALQARIASVMEQTVPAGSPVALVDFPIHSNVGDYAIWLGQQAYLRSTGCRAIYMSAQRDYSPERLAERIGQGTILIHGGGNLGDLWPSHQDLRERVLQDFPDHRVVQLPQSIHFNGRERLETAKRAFAAHRQFTLLVRDAESMAFAERHFDCSVSLCPDSAFALGPQRRMGAPGRDVVCLARTDRESAFADEFAGLEDVELVDWVHDPAPPYAAVRRGALAAPRRYKDRRLAFRAVAPAAWRGFQYLAERQFRLGLRLLSQGTVVVTDRLHGHIVCLLLDIPHVMVDNSYGKVRSFYNAWTRASGRVRWSEHPDEALLTARDWARELRESGPASGR